MRQLIYAASIVLFTTYTAGAKTPQVIPFSNTIGWTLCQDKERFDCMVVKDRRIGKKTATETWESLFSNAVARELVEKINRLNIKLRKGMFIAVPEDKNKTLADFSPFPETLNELKNSLEIYLPYKDWATAAEAMELIDSIDSGQKVIIWHPGFLAAAFYDEKGNLTRWMPAIGGRDRCLDTWKKCRTVTGKFKVEFLGDENSRSHLYPIGCPRKEPCAKMPHFVGFYQCYPRQRMCFYGFHASEKMEGKHASHGCIRLFLDDAKWLNKEFAKIGTLVVTMPYPK